MERIRRIEIDFNVNPLKFIEKGVCYGKFSAWLSESVAQRYPVKIYTKEFRKIYKKKVFI